MHVNADYIRAATTSTSGTLNDLRTDLIMAKKNNNMLSIAVLTNEGCTAWSDAFFVLAINGTTVWLCLVKSVSFISLGG